jgi:hypothetical protein
MFTPASRSLIQLLICRHIKVNLLRARVIEIKTFPLHTESGCHSSSSVCYMLWYIYLLQLGFQTGGSGRYTCTKIGKRQLYTKGEIIQKTIQKHRIYKIENKLVKNIKKHKSSNYKIINRRK